MNNFRLTNFVAAMAAALSLTLPQAAWSQSLNGDAIDALKQKVERVQPRMVEWRRHIHQQAELSGQEVQTAAYVAQHLRALGYEVFAGNTHDSTTVQTIITALEKKYGGVWAPYYTFHKIMQGLLDVYTVTGNPKAYQHRPTGITEDDFEVRILRKKRNTEIGNQHINQI